MTGNVNTLHCFLGHIYIFPCGWPVHTEIPYLGNSDVYKCGQNQRIMVCATDGNSIFLA